MGGPQLLDEVIGRDAPEVERAHGEHFEKLQSEVRPLPGAAELLQHARAAGFHVYVVTSSKPSDAEFLLGLLPGSSVDGVVHGDDVSRTKPHPDLFRVAVDRWAWIGTSVSPWAIPSGTSKPLAEPAFERWGCSPGERRPSGCSRPARWPSTAPAATWPRPR
jgi:hypothetical protein